MTHPAAMLPELRWTAAALPATELTLVAVFSPEDQTVRASGVAVPEGAVCTEMLELYQVDGIITNHPGRLQGFLAGRFDPVK